MNEETIDAIRQSKAIWLDQFTRLDVIFALGALVVLITVLLLDLWKSRTAATRQAAIWWGIGAGLIACGSILDLALIYALVRDQTGLLRTSLLAIGALTLLVTILWTRSGIVIETSSARLRRQLADAHRTITQHQTQLDTIVSRRTQVLNEEIIERRRAQQQLTREMEQDAVELEFASDMQQALLDPPPQLPFVEIRVNFQAASEVSGDTYSFVHHDGLVRLVVADAMGHGVSAALLTQLVLASSLAVPLDHPAEELFERLNRLISNGRQHAYVTASWLTLDAAGKLHFSGAGNAPLLIYRAATRAVETLDGSGQPLGMFEEIFSPHGLQVAVLAPGDRVLAMTDGLLEWPDTNGKMFGVAGVERALIDCAEDSLEFAIAGLQNAAWEHAGMRRCQDDITVIGMEYTGAAPA